jgi:hypothetical protein
MRLAIVFSILSLSACGASDHSTPTASAPDGGPGDGLDDDGTARLVGTVWAPGNAPGLVPPGHEIPVAGAMVYLGHDRPDPIEQRAQCTPCVEAPPAAVITDSKGYFELHPAPGTYWLIVQKAQFRIEQQLVVTGQPQAVPAAMTTLPSIHDPENGLWTPRIALAAGDYDAMESILGKMGIGVVGSDGAFVAASATGRFDVYSNGGWDLEEVAVGSLTDLVSDLDKMMNYHIIFIPCAGDENNEALKTPAVLRNIRDYVAAGGRLYVTDWSGEWADNVFPGEVQLSGGEYDTPPTAYDRAADTWNMAQFGTADGDPDYTSPDGEAVDPDLASWLDGQIAPGGYPIDASNFVVEGNWNHITGLTDVEIGVDEAGQPVLDSPKAYVMGSDGTPGGKKPLTATYEPAGCGRVLYSTYHTTESVHVGLEPQERVLLYLLLEIGVCKDAPDID